MKKMKNKLKLIKEFHTFVSLKKYLIILIIIIVIIGYYLFKIPKKVYYAKDFNIEVITSQIDYNNNGIDDYTDILNGAKKEAMNHSKYKSAYYNGGYPPSDEGVCTDVVWRALKEAGYLLKDLVDEDINNNIDLYKRVDGKPDPNIDFRRVPNLQVFFSRHTLKLTTEEDALVKWSKRKVTGHYRFLLDN